FLAFSTRFYAGRQSWRAYLSFQAGKADQRAVGVARDGFANCVGGRAVLQCDRKGDCGVARGVGEVIRTLGGVDENFGKPAIGKAPGADCELPAPKDQVKILGAAFVGETRASH